MIDWIAEIVDWQLAHSPAAHVEQDRSAAEVTWPSSMYMPVTAWDGLWATTIGFGS